MKGPKLARRMRHYMRRADLTQADISRGLGVTEPSVHAWMHGKNTPTLANLERFTRLCGIDLATFWGPLLPWPERPAAAAG